MHNSNASENIQNVNLHHILDVPAHQSFLKLRYKVAVCMALAKDQAEDFVMRALKMSAMISNKIWANNTSHHFQEFVEKQIPNSVGLKFFKYIETIYILYAMLRRHYFPNNRKEQQNKTVMQFSQKNMHIHSSCRETIIYLRRKHFQKGFCRCSWLNEASYGETKYPMT